MASYNIELNYFDGSNYNVLYPKISWSNNSGGTINSSYIPNLAANKITSGTFDSSRIPDLDMSKITTGNLPASRITGLNNSGIQAIKSHINSYTGTGGTSLGVTVSFNLGIPFLFYIWDDGNYPQASPAIFFTFSGGTSCFNFIYINQTSISGNMLNIKPTISNNTYTFQTQLNNVSMFSNYRDVRVMNRNGGYYWYEILYYTT